MEHVTHKKQGGFTLVELVMVIVVIALLSAYIGPKFAALDRQARMAQINKLSGSIAESIQVSKAISIVELDASVAETLAGAARTAINYDGIASTTGATGLIAGEDIFTEFHYPKAISTTTSAAAGSGTGDAIDSADSILFVLKVNNASIAAFREGLAAPTIANLETDCGTTSINNDGDAADANKFVAYETQADATNASAVDTLTIHHCGALSKDYADNTLAATTLNCNVVYTDAGTLGATPATDLDVFSEPTITVTTSGC